MEIKNIDKVLNDALEHSIKYISKGNVATFIGVGMPAKSGVGGGILASADNKVGIGVFGPSLDSQGNSVGGYHILEYLSKEIGLHYFSCN